MLENVESVTVPCTSSMCGDRGWLDRGSNLDNIVVRLPPLEGRWKATSIVLLLSILSAVIMVAVLISLVFRMGSRTTVISSGLEPYYQRASATIVAGFRVALQKPACIPSARSLATRTGNGVDAIRSLRFPPFYEALQRVKTNPTATELASLTSPSLLLASKVPALLDPWSLVSTHYADSTIKKRPQLVKRAASHYRYNDGPEGRAYHGTRKVEYRKDEELNVQVQVQCLLTGLFAHNKSGPGRVVAAHILPRSLPDHIFQSFGLPSNARDHLCNLLPLCDGIEKAFDSKRITFRVVSEATVGDQEFWGLLLIILDGSVKTEPLWKGAKAKIGDFSDQRFWIKKESRAYTTILDYHDQVALYSALERGWTTYEQLLHVHHQQLFWKMARQSHTMGFIRPKELAGFFAFFLARDEEVEQNTVL